MPKRVTMTLDDDAWELYHKQPFRQRGAWVSQLIRDRASFPPLLTATEAQRLYDHYGAYLRWIHTKAE